ncbi:hypothetical protein B0J11DRAFT_512361 [Dendryphion nanum]|uniref:Uncharacterized protein n=1 Tax=Dendryphion nanum TaxID=256645 RepID=A0A9P9D1N6_9PLEO|nr:hypothetical protein B0J11DRAFT_512361 [Dendryphion nanum]
MRALVLMIILLSLLANFALAASLESGLDTPLHCKDKNDTMSVLAKECDFYDPSTVLAGITFSARTLARRSSLLIFGQPGCQGLSPAGARVHGPQWIGQFSKLQWRYYSCYLKIN